MAMSRHSMKRSDSSIAKAADSWLSDHGNRAGCSDVLPDREASIQNAMVRNSLNDVKQRGKRSDSQREREYGH